MGAARRRRGHVRRRQAALRQRRDEDCIMTVTIVSTKDELRDKALKDLQQFQVLMLDGHFDFGNGYHGRVYLNPHRLLRYPSTIWRFAQDLIDVLPASVLDQTEVVAGPATGGALLAHTVAALRDDCAGGGRQRDRDRGALRPHGGVVRRGRTELRAGGIQGAGELSSGPL